MPDTVNTQNGPRLTAAEAKTAVNQARESRIGPILNRIEVAILVAISEGRTVATVPCTTDSQDVVNEILADLKERGYTARHTPSSGWPAEEWEHFKISF